MDSLKRFSDKKLPDKKCFCNSVKDGTTKYDDGEKLDGQRRLFSLWQNLEWI